jgi:hypothetical protein
LGYLLVHLRELTFVIKSDKLGVPLQISGSYWGDKIGGIEVGYNFYQNNDSSFQSFQIITGYSDIEKKQSSSERWKYIGISTTYKKGGFLWNQV